MLPVAAAAYTVVLRSGQRVQIPDQFTVTKAGISYASAPRMEITIQMSVINVAATEAANREPAGALRARIGADVNAEDASANDASVSYTQTNSAGPARKVLTNADLDGYRRAREANEAAFDQRQREQGLPTLAVLRQRQAAEDAQQAERSRVSADAQLRNEQYWRARSNDLRGQLNAIDRQIGVVRGQIRATPRVSLRAPQVDIDGYAVHPGRYYGDSPAVDTYARSRSLRDLRVLQQQRAVLSSQWNDLQEEARRAGAPPGWLRPY